MVLPEGAPKSTSKERLSDARWKPCLPATAACLWNGPPSTEFGGGCQGCCRAPRHRAALPLDFARSAGCWLEHLIERIRLVLRRHARMPEDTAKHACGSSCPKSRASESGQDLGHTRGCRVDLLNGSREAEAEAHPVAAMVGMNIGGGERSFDLRRIGRAEGKKVAVGLTIAKRRD
jgi:hypothetical protein